MCYQNAQRKLGNESITAGNILTERITYNQEVKVNIIDDITEVEECQNNVTTLCTFHARMVVVNDFRKCGNHTTRAEYGLMNKTFYGFQ